MSRKFVSIHVKNNGILLRDIEISQRKICRQLKISCCCQRQTICKLNRDGIVPSRPRAGRLKQNNDSTNTTHQTSTNSLTDLIRRTNTNMKSTSTISCILRQYKMLSSRVPRKARITAKHRRARVD